MQLNESKEEIGLDRWETLVREEDIDIQNIKEVLCLSGDKVYK